jgi:hypothetical protein
MASSAGARAPGLHTPTQSFSSSPADTVTPGQAMNLNDKKKLKEEIDIARQRLSDTKFNMRESFSCLQRMMFELNKLKSSST